MRGGLADRESSMGKEGTTCFAEPFFNWPPTSKVWTPPYPKHLTESSKGKLARQREDSFVFLHNATLFSTELKAFPPYKMINCDHLIRRVSSLAARRFRACSTSSTSKGTSSTSSVSQKDPYSRSWTFEWTSSESHLWKTLGFKKVGLRRQKGNRVRVWPHMHTLLLVTWHSRERRLTHACWVSKTTPSTIDGATDMTSDLDLFLDNLASSIRDQVHGYNRIS